MKALWCERSSIVYSLSFISFLNSFKRLKVFFFLLKIIKVIQTFFFYMFVRTSHILLCDCDCYVVEWENVIHFNWVQYFYNCDWVTATASVLNKISWINNKKHFIKRFNSNKFEWCFEWVNYQLLFRITGIHTN